MNLMGYTETLELTNVDYQDFLIGDILEITN